MLRTRNSGKKCYCLFCCFVNLKEDCLMYMLDGLDLKFDFKVAEAASIVVLKIYVLSVDGCLFRLVLLLG